ncbi:hypothetical protein HAALTHF_12590n [Vreelandella aquamarina]|nr:hypothetical protein HAALTHF_12590n [Halomonas axialensis]
MPRHAQRCLPPFWPGCRTLPRGTGPGAVIPEHLEPLAIGEAQVRRESTSDGVRIALLAFGSVNSAAAEVAEKLNATHINMRSVKPLDRDAVLHAADEHELLVTPGRERHCGWCG